MHRHGLLLVTATVSLVLVAATGGFNAATMDRSVSVAVTNDDSALVGVDDGPIRIDNGDRKAPGTRREVTLLTLTNRLGDPIGTVEVTVQEPETGAQPPPNLQSTTTPDAIRAGESRNVTGRIVCGNATDDTERWTITIVVETQSRDVTVRLTRTISVTCTGDPP